MFYTNGTFETQTAIIGRSVKSGPVCSRRGRGETITRNFSRQYFIPTETGDVKVCKKMFLKTLQTDSAKIHRALKKVTEGTVTDLRGKHIPHNKAPEERINYVKMHITSFPRYRSHYCREDNPNKMFLHHGLNLSIMYRLYKEKMSEDNLVSEIVSQSLYENIFYKEFNLSFKPPHKDSCKTCDIIQTKLLAAENDTNNTENVHCLKIEQELHHRKVESARSEMNSDKEKALKGDITVLTFDLQKTFLLPKVPTGVVYYKRQLSCFNLGIHDLGNNTATMNIWHEGLAGRGPDEIGSCLLKYFRHNDVKDKVVLWSDSCGGQNRNFKLTTLLLQLVQDNRNNIKEIEMKFAIPGHSYLPNDTDFGHIENKMKLHQHIFCPDQLIDIIKKSRTKKTPFHIVKMTSDDFICSDSVTKSLTNRKKTNDKTVSWLKIRNIRLTQNNVNGMEYKYSLNPEVKYDIVCFAKRTKGRSVSIQNIILKKKFPNGRPINQDKLKDLKSMMCFVPPVYHQFYNDLNSSNEGNENTSEDEDNDC